MIGLGRWYFLDIYQSNTFIHIVCIFLIKYSSICQRLADLKNAIQPLNVKKIYLTSFAELNAFSKVALKVQNRCK